MQAWKRTFVTYFCLYFIFIQPLQPVLAVDGLPDPTDRQPVTSSKEELNHDIHPLDQFRLLKQAATVLKGGFWASRPGLYELTVHSPHAPKEYITYGSSRILEVSDAVELRLRNQAVLTIHEAGAAAGFYKNYLVLCPNSVPVHKGETVFLYFIDLKFFARNLGVSELPIFRMPVQVAQSNAFEITQEGVQFYGNTIPAKVFEQYSLVQQLAYNLNVSLIDPQTLPETREIVTDLIHSLEAMFSLIQKDSSVQGDVNLESFVKSLTRQTSALSSLGYELNDAQKEDERTKDQQKKETRLVFHRNDISESAHEMLAKHLKSHAKLQTQQKKIVTRIKMLWQRLTFPQPTEVPKLKQALCTVLGAFSSRYAKNDISQREAWVQLVHHRGLRLASTVMGATVACQAAFQLGVGYPEVAAFLEGSFDIVSKVMNGLLGKASDAATLLADSTRATFNGFSPYVFADRYLTEDRFPKLAVGMTAAFSVLFLTLGTPHLIVNSFHLLKDMIRLKKEGVGKNLIARFIERQNQVEQAYLQNLASTEESAEGKTAYSEEEERQIVTFFQELREKEKGWVGRFADSLRSMPGLSRLWGRNEHAKMTNLYQALSHLLISTASLAISGKLFAQSWNSIFAIRSFVWHPTLWLTFLYYPNYYRVAVKTNLKGLHPPTEWNGGFRSLPESSLLQLRSWFGDTQLRKVRAFEKSILSLEERVTEKAFHEAFRALIDYTQDPRGLVKLVENGVIKHLDDAALFDLNQVQKRFLLRYVHELQEQVIHRLLIAKLQLTPSGTISEAKAEAVQKEAQLEFSDTEIAHAIAEIQAEEFYEKIFEHCNSTEWTIARLHENLNEKNLELLAPSRNRQVSRIQAVLRQINNPQAIARAVRAVRASVFVDKPLELFLLFVCTAAVTTGINQALYDEMFGPNSWYYLGRLAILNGYLSGVIIAVLSEIWMKLQQDEKNEGTFDKDLPTLEEQKRGYVYWYGRQFFSEKNNWWKNQKIMTSIVFANMKAWLVMALAMNFISLGRFDLDMFILGYVIAYCPPFMGLALKLEQAFEFSVGYDKGKIPKEYWAHPLAQRYVDEKMSKKRLYFNVIYKVYENVTGFFFQNLETITSGRLGPRSFARFLFGGYTPTELVVAPLAVAARAQVPVVSKASSICIKLLTNNMK